MDGTSTIMATHRRKKRGQPGYESGATRSITGAINRAACALPEAGEKLRCRCRRPPTWQASTKSMHLVQCPQAQTYGEASTLIVDIITSHSSARRWIYSAFRSLITTCSKVRGPHN